MAADVFLELNGYFIPSSKETLFEKLVLEVAQGKVEKPEIAAFFRKHSKKITRKKSRTKGPVELTSSPQVAQRLAE